MFFAKNNSKNKLWSSCWAIYINWDRLPQVTTQVTTQLYNFLVEVQQVTTGYRQLLLKVYIIKTFKKTDGNLW